MEVGGTAEVVTITDVGLIEDFVIVVRDLVVLVVCLACTTNEVLVRAPIRRGE